MKFLLVVSLSLLSSLAFAEDFAAGDFRGPLWIVSENEDG